MEQPPPQCEEMAEIQGVDFSLYHVYKPRRGVKRGEESKETYKLPHRLIEKKRRDRINECISQLKDLLPENLKLTTLGHLEKAVVLELTLKHVNGLTSLLEQQQQKILALQSGMQIEQPPAVSQEKTEEMFRSGFHLCAKEVLTYLANQESDGDLAPPQLVDHIQALAAEVLQGQGRPPRTTPPTSPPAEEVVPAPHHPHHHHHHHHHHHQSHKDKPVAALMAAPRPSGEGGYGRNCVPVIQRTFAAAAAGGGGEQSGSDTDTDSGYGGELERASATAAPQGDHAHHAHHAHHHRDYYYHYGQESQLKRALAQRRGSAHFKQEGDEPRHKRARSESSESDESLSGGESSSSSSSSSSLQRPYVSASPHHQPPLCVPFYLLPPSAAAAYLPMLEKVWYPGGGVPMLYPGHHGSSSSTPQGDRSAHPPPPPQLMMSPRGGASSPAPPPMDSSSPALAQALQQAPPIDLETKD